MTGCYATDFIKRRHQEISNELDDVYETVTVRLEAKNALMLKALSQVYQFPVSTSFTDIVSKHLVDVLISLNDDDFDTVTAPLDKQLSGGDDGSVVGTLRKLGILPEADFRKIFGMPDFSRHENTSSGKETDSE